MRAIPQLVSAPSNPIPIVEHFRWNHPQCKHSYRQEMLIAEIQRAKRASEVPWVRKIGHPSSRENLVMTSAYSVRPSKRASERLYIRGGRGRGVSRYSSRSPIWETLFLAVFCSEKSEKHSFLFAMSTNTIGVVDLTFQGRV